MMSPSGCAWHCARSSRSAQAIACSGGLSQGMIESPQGGSPSSAWTCPICLSSRRRSAACLGVDSRVSATRFTGLTTACALMLRASCIAVASTAPRSHAAWVSKASSRQAGCCRSRNLLQGQGRAEIDVRLAEVAAAAAAPRRPGRAAIRTSWAGREAPRCNSCPPSAFRSRRTPARTPAAANGCARSFAPSSPGCRPWAAACARCGCARPR
jgi:hypothetical protein